MKAIIYRSIHAEAVLSTDNLLLAGVDEIGNRTGTP